MENAWIVTGGVGFLLSCCYGAKLDKIQHQVSAHIQKRIKNRTLWQESLVPELPVITRLIASLRSGQSLDSSIEQIISENDFPSQIKHRLRKVINLDAERDFFSQFLQGALKSGAPITNSLNTLQRMLLLEKKLRLRAHGISGQARAQAEVLTWLPWFLAIGIAVIDPEWLTTASKAPESWLCWSAALALCGLGRAWILRTVDRCLSPSNESEAAMEKDLPALVLRLSTQLSLGSDPSTCLEGMLAKDVAEPLKSWMLEKQTNNIPKCVRGFRALIQFADQSGAPLRAELENFLFELQSMRESRWEERLQQLPIKLLAPLFCCFFPTSLLILAGVMLPLFKEML